MSSVSSIRPRLNINSKIAKKVDNTSLLNNKNLENFDIAIIRNSDKEYVANFTSPVSIKESNPENVADPYFFLNMPIPSYSSDHLEENDKNAKDIFGAASSKEIYNNQFSASNLPALSENENVNYNVGKDSKNSIDNSNIRWNVLRPDYFSELTIENAKELQKSFKELIKTGDLDQKFLNNIHNKTVFLNGQKIPSNDAADIIDTFQYSFRDYEAQQLISTYAHPGVLDIAWNNLSTRFPSVDYRKSYNVRVIYEIDQINSDTYKVAVTKFADLEPSYSDSVNEISQYGVRSTMLINKNIDPEIRYAFFAK